MKQLLNSQNQQLRKFPIKITAPSGDEKTIYVTYDGQILDIIENDVIRVIRGNLIEIVTGDRIQRIAGKNITVADDYNVLSGKEVHLNPGEYYDFYNLDDVKESLYSESNDEECNCKKLNDKKKCHFQLLEKVLIGLLAMAVILQLYLVWDQLTHL